MTRKIIGRMSSLAIAPLFTQRTIEHRDQLFPARKTAIGKFVRPQRYYALNVGDAGGLRLESIPRKLICQYKDVPYRDVVLHYATMRCGDLAGISLSMRIAGKVKI